MNEFNRILYFLVEINYLNSEYPMNGHGNKVFFTKDISLESFFKFIYAQLYCMWKYFFEMGKHAKFRRKIGKLF